MSPDMEQNKVGIIELKDDPFILDVLSRLSDSPVEFLSFADWTVPITTDYRVVVDRLSYRSSYLKEVVRNLALDGTYVINNPFTASVSNKMLDEWIFKTLGIPSPKAVVLPGSEPKEDLGSVFNEPSWSKIADEVGLPCVLKPVDGYGWDYVYMVNTLDELKRNYASAGMGRVWLVQQKVNYKHYYRVFCIDKKDVLFIKWIPRPLGAGEYLYSDLEEIEDIKDRLVEQTIRLNSCLDMDINVVEWCVDGEGRPWVIDAFNEVPDVPKSRMPPQYYGWIVDRFVACIKSKLNSGEKNTHSFNLPNF
jgi:hypothetical protein